MRRAPAVLALGEEAVKQRGLKWEQFDEHTAWVPKIAYMRARCGGLHDRSACVCGICSHAGRADL